MANEVAGELAGKTVDGGEAISAGAFVSLVKMEQSGELTPAQSRHVLKVMVAEGGDPASIASALGYQAMDPGTLASVIDDLIAANQREWERYAAGDDKLAGFFIGKVKAATRGNADLKAATELLRQRRGG